MGTTCPCKKIKRVTQRERDRQTDTTPIIYKYRAEIS